MKMETFFSSQVEIYMPFVKNVPNPLFTEILLTYNFRVVFKDWMFRNREKQN